MRSNKAIFFASFLTLIAAGIGFGVRAGILVDWAAQYGFTQLELGTITGGGLVGFGIVILAASVIVDHIGYKMVMVMALALHVLSAVITVAATPIFYATDSKIATYWCLYIGVFIFSVANGLCEAAINPLTATLYPNQKTHYLNILHAGWPGGLIIGGLIIAARDAFFPQIAWEILIALYLVPTIVYGMIVVTNRFPISEAKAAGVSYGQMLLCFLSPILLLLLFLHACVGYVELGTDSWIQNITSFFVGQMSAWLFIYASVIMFVLRFFAGPIVERINPLGLLLVSALLGSLGLFLIGNSSAALFVWIAMTVYAVGKTFFWPTMLGVVGERYPQGGAIVMGFIGGIGMLSAGLLGGPGIGYKQDYFASSYLKEEAPETYQRYEAAKPDSFLFLPAIKGLDGTKVGVIVDPAGPGTDLAKTVQILKDENRLDKMEAVKKTEQWWQSAQAYQETDKSLVQEARIYGGQMALILTALVPLTMAFGYLILVIYFRATGGYQAESLRTHEPEGEEFTGGVEAPVM